MAIHHRQRGGAGSAHRQRGGAGSAHGQRGGAGSAHGLKAFPPLDPRSKLSPDMSMQDFLGEFQQAQALPLVADQRRAPLDAPHLQWRSAKENYKGRQPMTVMLENFNGARVWLGCRDAAENRQILRENGIQALFQCYVPEGRQPRKYHEGFWYGETLQKHIGHQRTWPMPMNDICEKITSRTLS